MAGTQSERMLAAEDPLLVGEYLAVLALGFGVTSLPADRPGQGVAGGQGIGVVIAEDPLLLGEYLAVHLLSFVCPGVRLPGRVHGG